MNCLSRMAELPPGASATPVSRYVGTRAGAQSGSPAAALQHRASLSKHTSQPTQPLKMRCVHAAEGRCLSREGGSGNTRQRRWRGRECSGNTRQRQCRGREGSGNTRKRRCLSGEGGSGNTQGKGGVFAARAVGTQGQRRCLSREGGSGNTQGKGGVITCSRSRLLRSACRGMVCLAIGETVIVITPPVSPY